MILSHKSYGHQTISCNNFNKILNKLNLNIQKNHILSQFSKAQSVLKDFLENEKNIDLVLEFSKLAAKTLAQDNKIITCGNGGSMCDAMHMAEELSGKFKNNRKALAAMAISDPAHISCVANDYGYSEIFARSVYALGKRDDLLVGLSTSGNSENLIKAFTAAKKMQLKTVGLLGNDGGALLKLSDIALVIPSFDSARIQEIHIKIIHITIDMIENQLGLVEPQYLK